MNFQPGGPPPVSAIPPPPSSQQPLFTESTIATDVTRGAESRESELLSLMAIKSSGILNRPQDAQGRPPGAINPGSRPPPGWTPAPYLPPPPKDPPAHHAPKHTGSSVLHSIRKNRATSSVAAPYTGRVDGWRQDLAARRDDGSQDDAENGAVSGLRTTDSRRARADDHTFKHQKGERSSVPLASALGSIATKYLDLDVLGESDKTSEYISFLLDTIQNLQSRVEFLSTSDLRQDVHTPAGSDAGVEPVPDAKVRFQVLHRVFCGASLHGHNIAIYEDEPKLTTLTSGLLIGEEVVTGEVAIPDVEAYLRSRPGIQFVVFKESFCTTEPVSLNHRAAKSNPSAIDFDYCRESISTRKERLMVVSPALQQTLDDVATCKQDDVDFEGIPDITVEMEAPYYFLFHHRRKLKDLCEYSPESHLGLGLLLTYLEEHFATEYLEADNLMGKHLISDAHIEKLFKPNQIIVGMENEQLVAFCLDEWPRKVSNVMRFSAWSWCYNGRRLERERWYKAVEMNISNTKDIRKLPFCPLEFLSPDLLARLRERGRKFWDLKTQKLVTYNGWDRHHDYHYFNERFMVDMATYTKMFPRSMTIPFFPPDAEVADYDNMPARIDRGAELTDEQVLLLPPATHGYSLREKKWVSINIEQMSEVVWNKKAFDLLVLEEETKSLLRALIDVRMSKAKKFDDIVSGKGNGLVMLLHGSPGTGKSLTAESVAEFAEKPLFRVTCGDIGTDPERVEGYLSTIFYLGKTWDCVLLLDEADVFLEERSVNDLQRNSLVSIFLRSLEFYEGIIILTSNRVGTFDEAFQSRIRVALRYEPLSTKSRRVIWNNLFNMLIDDDEDVKVDIPNLDRRLDDLATYKLNGRQIRNALLTARQLALHRQESLEWAHLQQVLKLSDSFNQYLRKVKGHSDEEWAKSQALR